MPSTSCQGSQVFRKAISLSPRIRLTDDPYVSEIMLLAHQHQFVSKRAAQLLPVGQLPDQQAIFNQPC